VLRGIDKRTRGVSEKGAALAQAYEKESSLRYQQEPFICHMLREVVGKKKSLDIFDAYVNLRVSSGEPVATERFQTIAEDIYGKPLGWFWEQWLGLRALPQLRLRDVRASEAKEGWRIRGSLSQVTDSVFRLPIELELRTDKETKRKKVLLEKKSATFEFHTSHKPNQIIVDPDHDILKIQNMPPLLSEFWGFYPNYAVVYGTAKEVESNRAASHRFCSDYLGLGEKVIKADVDANEAYLKNKCVILFGRPNTNKIAQRFQDSFPIKFEKDKFTWQGTTYDQPSQGVAQIVENPNNPKNLVILYAGLSGDATQKFCDLYLYDANASYVIFDQDKQLVSGDWKVDSDLYWNFKTHPSVRSAPNEQ